jgi:hypothetical protein
VARRPYYRDAPTLPDQNQFSNILEQGLAQGMTPVYTQRARDWFRKRAQGVPFVNESQLMKSEPDRFRSAVVPGKMYLFQYDPKLKKELPYYDRLPLIFPIDVGAGYILGLNMHYLPYDLRAKLMDALYPYINNLRLDETTALKVRYRVLKVVSKLAPYKVCIKKYLRNHVRSRFISIDAAEWDIALFLPLERFEKATKRHVWAESRKKLNMPKPASLGKGPRRAR